MAIRVTTSSGETVTSNIFTLTITSGVSTDTYYTVKYNLNNATSSNSNTTVKRVLVTLQLSLLQVVIE